MSRSIQELRTAASDSGWETDPLAAEILSKLSELESTPGTPVRTAQRPWILLTVALWAGAATATAIVAIGTQRSALSAHGQEIERMKIEAAAVVAQKDHEIAWLKESNAAKLTEASQHLDAAVKAVTDASKNSVNSADMSKTALDILLREIARLQTPGASPTTAK